MLTMFMNISLKIAIFFYFFFILNVLMLINELTYWLTFSCRLEKDTLDWDVAAVLNMNRTQFGPKGPLELNSEKLIKEASHGECRNVYRILRDGKVHPDVSDARGYTALIAATVSYSFSMIQSNNLKCSLAFCYSMCCVIAWFFVALCLFCDGTLFLWTFLSYK